jgi:hypothetical protein
MLVERWAGGNRLFQRLGEMLLRGYDLRAPRSGRRTIT